MLIAKPKLTINPEKSLIKALNVCLWKVYYNRDYFAFEIIR